MMTSLTLCRLHVTIRLLNNAYLPPYKGSCIRGALGHGMRKISCSTGAPSCGGCPKVGTCDFTKLFKPDQIPGKSIPAPYVIDPPPLRETRFKKGSEIIFTLTLFGTATDYLRPWTEAIQTAGARFGLGEDRALFELIRIEAENTNGGTITAFIEGKDIQTKLIPRISLTEVIADYAASPAQRAQVHLLTPLKFKDKGAVAEELTAQLFFETLVRRIKALTRFYAPETFANDYHVDLSCVCMQRSDLRWITLERISMNHPDAVNLGGFVGSFELTGLNPHLLALLAFGTYTHLGKNTVYGCGKYKIELGG